MKIHLVFAIIIIVLAFEVNYVQTIRCFVCNSFYDKDCDQLKPNSGHLKDCDLVDAKIAEVGIQALDEKKAIRSNYTYNTTWEFLKEFNDGRRAEQCSKIAMDIDDDNETTRVLRGCSGVSCLAHAGCYKGMSGSQVKSESCFCDSDACNASHRRSLPNNFYLNFLIPILISISFLFN